MIIDGKWIYTVGLCVSFLLKRCLGTGLLALPEAFKIAGMINGIVQTLFVGVFCTYCLHVLVRGQYELCKKRRVGLLRYGDSMKVACEVGPDMFKTWASCAVPLTDFILVLYQTGTCCIYVVFVGTSAKYVVDEYTTKKRELYFFMLILFVPFYQILLIKNLKRMAIFSLIADILTFATFIVVFYYIFKDLSANFMDREKIGKLEDFPLLFGTVLFSLQSVPIVISIENDMATPKAFRKPFGPLNIAFCSLTLLYTATAILGYWRYGEDIKSSITMNFPVEEKFAQAVIISYCIAVYVSYGLNAYVPITLIWDIYILPKLENREASEGQKSFLNYMLRLLFAIITFFFAATVPLLGLFISLIGSLCLSLLGVIFPAFIEIAANWEEKITRPGTARFWKNIILMLFGVYALFCGSYSSIRSIVDTLVSGDY